MSYADVLVAGLPLTPLFTWPAFAILARASRRSRERSLFVFSGFAGAIAIMTTVYAAFVLADWAHLEISADVTTLGLVLPVYLMTAISGVFLWLYYRGEW